MKAAIVGCGGIAQVQANVLLAMEEATLVACADIKREKSEAFAQRFQCRPYFSLETMLESEPIDVLHVLTPHCLHVPMALQAAEKGVHVFVEKPAYIQPQGFRQLKEAAERVRVGVCFQNRYNANTRLAQSLLAGGGAGRPLGARAFVTWSRGEEYDRQSGWRGVLQTEGGGALINQGIHTLDLLVQLLGKPQGVSAAIANRHLPGIIEVEDTVEARIQFEGAAALLYVSTGYSGNPPVIIEIDCENCRIRLEDPNLQIWWKDGRREEIHFEQAAMLGKAYWGTGHDSCIRDFYRSIQQQTPFCVDVESVKPTMDLLFGLYHSARENTPVKL
ncbi:MAG: Gfo/Idh/MocA family protein [Oscillospiraceae bacterium]